MEGLPRAPHGGDRRAATRESREPVYRQPEESQPAVEYTARQPRSTGEPSRTGTRRPLKKGIIWTIVIVVFVIILGFGAWFIFAGQKAQPTGIDASRFQAVFLANGQIYFGKLESFSDSTFKMTKIYYPQTASDETASAATQTQNSNIQLIRLGDEVHGPDNEIYFVKGQVLYYENLKPDSKVSELIKKNEESK